MEAKQRRAQSSSSVRTLVRVGVLAAIAFIVMLLEFNLPLFPAFLQYDFSDVPALLGGFAMGPVAGLGIVTVRNLLFLISGKDEAGLIGTAANYLASFPMVVTAAWVYQKRKSLGGAIAGLVLGWLAILVTTSIGNYFVFLPAWGIPDPVARKALIIGTLVPFNTVRTVLTGAVTFALYKRVRDWLH